MARESQGRNATAHRCAHGQLCSTCTSHKNAQAFAFQPSDSSNNRKMYLRVFPFSPQSKSSQIPYLSSFTPVNRSHTQANYLAVTACKWCFGIMGFLFESLVLILRPLIFISYSTPPITVSIPSNIRAVSSTQIVLRLILRIQAALKNN